MTERSASERTCSRRSPRQSGIVRLRNEIRHHEERYYIHDRSGDLRRRVRRAAARARAARGRAPRSRHARLADAAGGRAADEGSRPSSTSRRCSASTTPTTRRSCARSTSACARAPALGDAPVDVRRRAEDRRPEHRADLRGRRAAPRRHARRRRARRGRHRRTSATIRAIPLPARRTGRRGTIEVRGEVYLPRALVRAHQPRTRGRRRAAVREPAERRRRDDAQPRSGAGGAARPGAPSCISSWRRRSAQRAHHSETARRDARVGAAGRAALAARAPASTSCIAFCRDWARQAPRRSSSTPTASSIKVDDLALRERLGDDREIPALGARRSSSRRSRRRPAAADRGERRPHRRRHAVRVLEPVFARRLDDLDGDAAQRRGYRAQGSARRRHGPHREGRRRHPEGRQADPRRSGRQLDAVGDADGPAPRAGARCSATKRKSSGAARTRSCPARLRRSLEHFASRTRDEHRRAWRVARRSAASSRGLSRTSPTCITSTRRARKPGRHAARAALGARRAAQARQGRPQRRRRRSSAASRTICRAWCTRSASAMSARRRRPRWRATSGRWTGCWTRRSRRCRRCRTSARSSPPRSGRSPTSRTTGRWSSSWRGGREHGEPAARAGRGRAQAR